MGRSVDRQEIVTFADELFRYADDGHVAARAFQDGGGNGRFRQDLWAYPSIANGLPGIANVVVGLAEAAAQPGQVAVVCPPLATFAKAGSAKEADLLQAPVLSIELDVDPAKALAKARGLIGPPTIVVASGGEWTDPATGRVHPKLHAHWRLIEPATGEDLALVKEVRRRLTALVGGDPSNVPAVHPIRWPGTPHRKNGENWAKIVELNPDAEVELQDVLDLLPTSAAPGGKAEPLDEHQGNAEPTDGLVGQILTGASYHGPLTAMAWRYAQDGMQGGKIVLTLRGLMKAVPVDRRDGGEPGRWQARYNDVPRIVRTAEDKLRRQALAEAVEEVEADQVPVEDERPVIELVGGELHTIVERCEEALGRAGGVYQRGQFLVRVERRVEPSAGSVQRAKGSMVIVPFDVPTMRLLLNTRIRFERHDQRSNSNKPVNCPKEVAEALLANSGHWPNIPPLLGIIEAPTLRPDGSVLQQPGYDPATGLYFDPGDTVFPNVPEHPTRNNALAALEELKCPLKDFPFASDADQAVALSMIMTAVMRKSQRSAPMFVISAPKMSSGKTLLATVGSYVATGRQAAVMSQADDAESEKKRLLSILMEGDALAVLDNVERPLGSDALCSILTEPQYRERLLGFNRTITVPTCTTWVVTGNNVTIIGDLTSRVLVCRIDPNVERPEEREFRVDLHKAVPASRGKLVVAVLTIVRAFIAAGSPKQEGPTFGRFEAWQQWCRYPLIWLGMADPCQTRKAAEGRDPVREQLRDLAAAWYAVFGEEGHTGAQAVKMAMKHSLPTGTGPSPEVEALRDAMQAVAGQKDGINCRVLGRFIARHENRIESGLKFQRVKEHPGGQVWSVRKLDEPSES
jgi:hypothetical protein